MNVWGDRLERNVTNYQVTLLFPLNPERLARRALSRRVWMKTWYGNVGNVDMETWTCTSLGRPTLAVHPR